MTTRGATRVAVTSETPALDRMLRILYLSCGLSGLVFAGLMLPTALSQVDHLQPTYALATIVIGLGAPTLLAPLAPWAPLRLMRIYAGSVVIAFAIMHLAFPWAIVDGLGTLDSPPWLQGINALHAVIAAVVWNSNWVWLYGVMQAPVVAFTQVLSRPVVDERPFVDALGGTLYSLIVMGTSLALIYAAKRVDASARTAREQAAAEASTAAREREESRINAIVHDDVMSVLYAAASSHPPTAVAEQATVALDEIERLAAGDSPDRPLTPGEVLSMLRAAAFETAPEADVRGTSDGDGTIPHEVAFAVVEALSETLRNSMRHAGGGRVERTVRLTVTPDLITARASDDGAGFDPATVSERRLGIRVSIVERMRHAGGDATVDSTPGQGTVVSLVWTRA
ncbi:sensor histidine kinase [Demequina sp. NBRC 110052]|uniref:sensor histidine kinase n=1 Tax=Demequina sp. NBRC 110052 TaxID=1570341 RepID=UPI0009FEC6AD|nr:sensor histidine kinase [Demequina sp. NBRC 110052]